MEQLLLSIDFMHKRRIIHRDIKLDNILISNIEEGKQLNVKISDFGLSRFLSTNKNEKLREKCGTPCYIAPEILNGHSYNEIADMFSIGSVFFNLLTGRYWFEGSNVQELLSNNKKCTIVSQICIFLKDFSFECRDLVQKLLSFDPNLRPTAE